MAMKRYLIVKVARDLGEAAVNWFPLPGLFTRQAAEEIVERERVEHPQTTFFIQEVGMA